jgi:putative phosphoribosyl transferase
MRTVSRRIEREAGMGAITHTGSTLEHQIGFEVQIPAVDATLNGDLNIPAGANSVVLFAHGSGSSRHSPRNQFVARVIREAGVGTLLFDLLTKKEENLDLRTAHLRFDIAMLARRLAAATRWLLDEDATGEMSVGYFGASTGGGAALVAAAQLSDRIGAIVSRGGRPDLAGDSLAQVKAPTLLIVGDRDYPVIEMNRDALAQLSGEKKLELVPGATHLFEEPGTLEQVAWLASEWFAEHLTGRTLN